MNIFKGGKYSDERKIAEGVRSGDDAAVKKLYDIWSGYLFALCTRYIPDRNDAEDILQESFLKIISSMDSFRWKGNGSLKAWMSRITVNEALQYLRHKKRCSFLEYDDRLPDIPEQDDSPDTERIPPSAIQKMIQELSDGYRTVFNLAVFEGKSHKEIAAILGISESTSASQFHRARKILAGKIREYETGHE